MSQRDTEEMSPLEGGASTVGEEATTPETARKEEEAAPVPGTTHEDIDIHALVQEADTTIDTITLDLQADQGQAQVHRDHLEEVTEEEMTKMIQEVLVLESQEATARIIIRFHRRKII